MSGENVIPLRRCVRCGAAGSRTELHYNDAPVGEFNGCASCIERTQAGLAHARPIFEAMIAAGVPRDVANETMSFLFERWDPESAIPTAPKSDVIVLRSAHAKPFWTELGWFCTCGVFNGCMKEQLTKCRCCDRAREEPQAKERP